MTAQEPRVLTAADVLKAIDMVRDYRPEPQPIIVSPATGRWIEEQGGFEAAMQVIANAIVVHVRKQHAAADFERRYAKQRANKRRRDRRR